MIQEFEKRDVHVIAVSVDSEGEDGSRSYIFTLEMPHSACEEEIVDLAKYRSSIKSAA